MFTTSSRFVIALAASSLLVTCPLLAHDFWLEPSAFRLEPGAAVELRLRVGEHFVGDALPRHPAMLAQFIAAGPGGMRPVPGQDGKDPAGVFKVEQPGLVVVGYRSRHSFVEQKPDKFDAYLVEEGLDRIAAVRATQKQPTGLVRELFSRCAKALLVAGPGAGSGHDRILGFTLELVPEKNPYMMRAGSALPVRLLYEGQPLAGTLIVAMNRADPSIKVRARSGVDGRVSLGLSRDGTWLIKAVHMIPAASGSGAHWESLWASLTFELAGPPAMRPAKKPRR
ncbi:MAG TPA: DUF4198 domain-containing protein [Vicinamibacterales bacterium]|nr:DUF4198 domain-containing protein [Vicinamibacterales bacterium]